ncbi:hypothetical protein QE109_10000 [Fusibacter bizertensis]|jgi:hypothetical protein|uniref:Helix-turn-helix domain-containing protein n=1 Tax=Fusibacter bizertensis TaxID=1488331 RepID=A0ABT6NDI2_9FIRM|nr:hypothetical protein [Fusibacter bizertensis]MDH8678479.1 hypothetical protein [Fusibacter bizertensis]
MEIWEAIEQEIFKNDRLDIYEKMCLLVLMSQGEEAHLTSIQLANYMGCGLNTAKRAFDSLRIKGFLAKDYEGETLVRRESNVVRNEEAIEISRPINEESDDFKAGFFKPVEDHPVNREDKSNKESSDFNHSYSENPEADRRRQMAAYLLGGDDEPKQGFVSKKESNQPLIDQVIDLIDEKISFKEANIILAFASGDMDKIRRKYKVAKQSQVSDTISVLINELQKKESTVIKSEAQSVENTQIDTNRLQKMQAYQNSRFKP